MPSFTVPRYSDAPLAFEGELIGSVSGEHTRPDKANNRWHEIDLYHTQSGKYVVAIRFRCSTRHDDPYDEAEVCQTPAAVVRFLNEFDPVEKVRGWPLEKHVNEDARLRHWLMVGFEQLASQLISNRAEFAERV